MSTQIKPSSIEVGSTYFITVAGVSSSATNISGGAAGTIPVQTAPGVTSFIPAGTPGQVLLTGASSAFWQSTSALNVGTTNTATNIAGGAAGYIPIQLAQGQTSFITTSSLLAGTAINSINWLGGTVFNPVTFNGNVTFNGTATYMLSTNTFYTDNLQELHVPPGGVGTPWTVDDGKDIGFRFHYYNGVDTNGALVLANDTKALEWYNSGAESNGGAFAGVTYGTFKTGVVKLVTNSAASGASNGTGDLQVTGGAGIGGSLYVGGSINGSGAGLNATSVPNSALQGSGTHTFTGTGGSGNIALGGTLTFSSGNGMTLVYSNGTLTVNTPQNLRTTDAPTFSGLTLTGLSGYLVANGSGALTSTGTFPNGALTNSSLTVTAGTGLGGGGVVSLGGSVTLTNNGILSITGVNNQISVTAGQNPTISLPQNIGTLSAPTFSGLTLTGLTGYLVANGAGALTASTTLPSAAATTAAVTFSNSGSGAASSTTFNGSTAQTISYNTIGAAALNGTNASGTWSISITGSAGSASASDVYAWAKAAVKPTYSASDVGLGNVNNTADSSKSVNYAATAGSAGSATTAGTAGTVTTAAQPVITSVGTLNGLTVSGGITATGDITAFFGSVSDRNLKTNIETIPNALAKINQLDGVTFNWNDKAEGKDLTKKEAGVIAQQVLEVLPEAVAQRDTGILGVHYTQLIPLLIESIKELSAEIEELKKRLA